MTGYQQAILYLCGSQMGNRFCVRNVDRHYLDAVADLFPGVTIYLQQRQQEGKKDYWCIKSPRVANPQLSEVSDLYGFTQGLIELQGSLTCYTIIDKRRGKPAYRRRFSVYGSAGDLNFIKPCIPGREREVKPVKTNTGETNCLMYQSKKEIEAILDYFSATDNINAAVWNKWRGKLI